MLIETIHFFAPYGKIRIFVVEDKPFLYLERSENGNVIHAVAERDCDEYHTVLSLVDKGDYPAARRVARELATPEDSKLDSHLFDVSCFKLTGCVPEPLVTLGHKEKITSTDCRTPVGVTVGLIDGIIAMARVIRHADLSSEEVQEALKDIRADEDMAFLMNLIK